MNWKQLTVGLVVFVVFLSLILAGMGNWLVNRYLSEKYVASRLESTLNREVKLSNLSFSLFRGINLEKLSVSMVPTFQEGTFLSARNVYLSPDLLSLLFFEFKVDRANLEDPRIRIVRFEDGSFNFTRKVTSEDQGNVNEPEVVQASLAAIENPSEGSESSEPTLDLRIGKFHLRDGVVNFVDQAKNENFEFTFSSVILSDIKLGQGGRVNVRDLSLGSGQLSGKMTYERDPFSVSFKKVKGQNWPAESFRSYYAGYLPRDFSFKPGGVDFRVSKGSITEEKVDLHSSVTVDSIDLTTGDTGDWPVKSMSLEGSISFNLTSKIMELRLSELSAGRFFSFKGASLQFRPPWNNPVINGNLRLNHLLLGELFSEVNSHFRTIPESLSLEGSIQPSKLRLQGPVNSLGVTGTLSLGDLKFTHDRLKGPISLTGVRAELHHPSQIMFSGSVRNFGDPVSFEGTIKDYVNQASRQFEVNLNGESLNLQRLVTPVDRLGWLPGEVKSLDGYLGTLTVDVEGAFSRPRVQASGTLKNASLALNSLPRTLNSFSGAFRLNESELSIKDLQGRYRGDPVLLSGTIPIPFQLNDSFSLKLGLERFPVGDALNYIPDRVLSDQYSLAGRITTRNLNVKGTPQNFTVHGKLQLEEGRLKTPSVTQPLKKLRGQADFRGRQAYVDSIEGSVGEVNVEASGTVPLEENEQYNLVMSTKDVRSQWVTAVVKALPEFPEGWKPEGLLSGTVHVSGKLSNPELSARMASDEFSLGPARTSDLDAVIDVRKRKVNLKQMNLRIFQGKLSGEGSFDSFSQSPKSNLTLDIDAFDPGAIFKTFFEHGHQSRGKIDGQVKLSGALRTPNKLDGSVNITGQNLLFKGVKLFSSLSRVLNLRLSQGEAPIKLLPIDPNASTKFDRGKAWVKFNNGRGTVRILKLVNKKMSIKSNGNVWLNGKLNLKIHLKPHSDLLEEIDRDWLRKSVKDGLPPLRLTGTVSQPIYHTDEFTQKIVEKTLENRLQKEANKALKDLFSDSD